MLRGHRDEVLDVAFSRDGALLATASRDETLRIWQTRDGMQVGVIVDHWKAVAATAFLPSDRHVLSLSIADGSVQVTEVDEPLDPAVTLEPSADIKSLVFSDDGTTVATVSQAVTQLWDAKKGRLLRTLAEAATNVTAAAFAPDGKRIATATADGSITIWQTDSGTVLRRLKGSVVVSASFSADGERILGVTEDGRVVAWRIESGEERVIAGHVPRLGWQAFSADRRQVTLASKSRVVHIWDADTGQLLLQAKSPDDAMVHFDRSPDGARIATISTSGTARVWNIRSEKTEFLLEQQSRFTRIAFSPDGLRLATASEDRTLRLWDAETGRLLNELKGHRDTLVSVAFAPSGTSVASIGSDRSVRLWPLVLGQRLIDEACSMVSRPLSPLRRAEFFLEPREGRCGPK